MYKNQNVLGGVHPGKKVLSPLYDFVTVFKSSNCF